MVELSLNERLNTKACLLMDGGMGSEIEHRGCPTRLPLWSAEALFNHPEIVLQIHKDYIEAGAEIITTNTFRTTRRAFARRGIAEQAAAAAALACQLAQQARAEANVHHPVFIAGSIAPLEDCYAPELTPPQAEIEAEHAELVSQLKEGGVDCILLETMITARETLSGVRAACERGMPFAVSFCCNEQLSLLGGERLEEVIRDIEPFQPLFVGVNCVSIDRATTTLRHMREITALPLCVYAQGEGLVDNELGWKWKTAEEQLLQRYLQAASSWLASGVQVIGGCCGTTPAYIRALHQLLASQLLPEAHVL
jgi:homocysteine S-methyltransferase